MKDDPDVSNLSLVELFCMEVKAQVAVMINCLLALESQPKSKEELTALMRAAHSIKGAARIVHINAAVTLAHIMEDCFAAAQAEQITLTTADIDILLQGVDILLHIADICIQNPNEQPPEDTKIKSLITAIAHIQTTPSLRHSLPQTLPPSLPPSNTPPNTSKQVVRVSTDNLNRLMGLAGESLVEAKWLEPFADSFLQLKASYTELSDSLEKLQELLANRHLERQIDEQLTAVRQKASEYQQLLGDRYSELELFSQRSTNLADRLYRQVIATRMCPFAEGGQGFPRMIRDIAKQLGKKVKLEIVGKSTLVDQDILERLEVSLTHMLRNAVDHGIESPRERLAAGKPEEGNIQIEVAHRAGMLFISVSDDGRGIDPEFLRLEIVRKQLTNAEMAAQLTESELMEFLFLPGFSTANTVTEISGRGVGLNVADNTIREVGGTVRAVSQPGKGMSFCMQLPLTLSVIRALLVEISGEPYAFPLSRIERVLMLSRSEIFTSENRSFFLMNNKPIELVSARQVLELPPSVVNSEMLSAIAIGDRTNRYGLVIDRYLGERSLVVRPLDPRLGKVPNISAAALMDNGSPVLIVDVEDLVRSIAKVFSTGQASQVNQATRQTTTKIHKRILVVDDSITVREMERKLLENNGYKVEVAVNGIDGWNALHGGNCDLVVTDIDMPRMNGFALTRQIKTHAKLKHIPVIIVSYKDREEDRLQGLEAGADYYLTKSSFHDDTLLQAVIDLIGDA
ncbi:hybrid sensor histidine kinase/response regulator [Scytonema sp. NUACC21]